MRVRAEAYSGVASVEVVEEWEREWEACGRYRLDARSLSTLTVNLDSAALILAQTVAKVRRKCKVCA